MVTIPPDTRYELIFVAAQDGQFLETVTFDLTVHYFDGIPTNMNNKSLWLGPSLDLGPLKLHPSHFPQLLWYDVLCVHLYPASYYWEKVERKKNEVEEKFPDFLRDLGRILEGWTFHDRRRANVGNV